jgi:hypothetical protein
MFVRRLTACENKSFLVSLAVLYLFLRIEMTLARNEIAQLNGVITALQKIVIQHGKPGNGTTYKKYERRVRRSGKELVAFRKMVVAERKKGVPVATLAKQHRVSTTYIYQLLG